MESQEDSLERSKTEFRKSKAEKISPIFDKELNRENPGYVLYLT